MDEERCDNPRCACCNPSTAFIPEGLSRTVWDWIQGIAARRNAPVMSELDLRDPQAIPHAYKQGLLVSNGDILREYGLQRKNWN